MLTPVKHTINSNNKWSRRENMNTLFRILKYNLCTYGGKTSVCVESELCDYSDVSADLRTQPNQPK